MHGLKRFLKRNKSTLNNNNGKPSNEVYIYTPLPNQKNGYIIEFRHSNTSEIYYYKYKENIDGTLTKYGYSVCDHYNRNYGNSKYRKNHKYEEQIDYKTLFNSNNKECIFYQTIADKVQIALEKRWMNELRKKGKLQVSAYDDDGEWSDLLQHNNSFFISDNIQRRRLDEILNNINLHNDEPEPSFSSPNQPSYNPRILHPLLIHQLSNDSNDSHTDLPLEENGGDKEFRNNYYEFYTPPLSPKTPPSSPTENHTNFTQKSLLNMNIRQRDKNKDKEAKHQEEQPPPRGKVRKLVHLTQPKFKKAPMVHIYDPEDTLEYKDCKCEYCLIGNYNE